jgi:hypothetical protein
VAPATEAAPSAAPPPAAPEGNTIAEGGSGSVDCDPHFGVVVGNYWFAMDDQTCRGASKSRLERLHSGADGLGCTIRWTGSVSTAPYPWGFAAAGVQLREGLDLAEYSTLVVAVRGDGRKYRLGMPMREQLNAQSDPGDRPEGDDDRRPEDGCDNRNLDFYGAPFTCGDGSDKWTELTFRIPEFAQEGWGNKWRFNASDVSRVQVQTAERPLEQFQCDFRVVSITR